MMHWFPLLFLIFTSTLLRGQNIPVIDYEKAYELPDSSVTLDVDRYYAMILANHPVVKQAELQTEKAEQALRSARGHFDPKIEATWDTKEFKGTDYYNILNAGLKIPVWFPVDVKAGIDRNTGVFLNPESSIPDANANRQMFLGVSVPLGKGLFIDQRRAVVKQAIAYQSLAEAERQKMLNKIFYQAAKDYYSWYNSYYHLQFLVQSISIANQIFERVKTDYDFGEAAVIDTIQAQITLQNRQVEYAQARIDYVRTSLTLSNHLWTESGEPLELTEKMVPPRIDDIPQGIDEQVYFQLLEMAANNHPEIRKLQAKIAGLQVQQQLNKENLKPQVDLSYSFLDEPFDSRGETSGFDFNDNYKLGLAFSFPIFLRKERGKIRETDLKLRESNYEVQIANRSIVNDLNATYAEINQLQNVISQISGVVSNYQRMVEAELINLQNGESDLFKINFQQEKLIDAQLKYLKLRTYYEKVRAELYYVSGIPNLPQQLTSQ